MTMRLIIVLLIAAIAPAKPLMAKEPEVRDFVSGSFDKIRHAHAGQPAIVHFWGLRCGPCLLELPEWGRLLRERPGVNLIVVHGDRLPEDPRMLTGTITLSGSDGVTPVRLESSRSAPATIVRPMSLSVPPRAARAARNSSRLAR